MSEKNPASRPSAREFREQVHAFDQKSEGGRFALQLLEQELANIRDQEELKNVIGNPDGKTTP